MQEGAGTYGSTLSAAAIKDDTRFSGTGMLRVAAGPGSDPYTTWIDSPAFNSPALSAADKLPGADPDLDGISNVKEFTLVGNPVVVSTAILPAVTLDPADLILTFKRSDESESPVTTQSVQVSTGTQDWTTLPAIPIGAASAGAATVVENGSAADDITVRIPRGGNSIKFGRLRVVK